MIVRDIMTRHVVFVRPDTPVSEVARLLVQYNISGVPVIENEQIVGLVSEQDLIIRDAIVDTPTVFSLFDSVFYLGSRKQFDEEMHKILATQAGELMSGKVVSISEDATVEQLATLMVKKEVNPVPVVGPDGRLSGIVSRSDLVRLMVRQEAEGLATEPPTALGVDDAPPLETYTTPIQDRG